MIFFCAYSSSSSAFPYSQQQLAQIYICNILKNCVLVWFFYWINDFLYSIQEWTLLFISLIQNCWQNKTKIIPIPIWTNSEHFTPKSRNLSPLCLDGPILKNVLISNTQVLGQFLRIRRGAMVSTAVRRSGDPGSIPGAASDLFWQS